MKYGQIVRVTTQRIGGGKPDVAIFAVAEEEPARAEEIVRKAIGALDEKVEAFGPIRWDILTDQFRLKAGEFTHL